MKQFRTKEDCTEAVTFNENAGMLQGRQVQAHVCACCGDVHLVAYDNHGKPFMAIPLDPFKASAFLIQLIGRINEGQALATSKAKRGMN